MFIKLLRNEELYASYESALVGIKTQLGQMKDGEVCLATYGNSWANSTSLLGIKRTDSYTIFDKEGNVKETQQLINQALTNLDATVGSTSVAANKHVAVQVVEVDGLLTSLTVTENDIASQAELEAIANAIKIDGTAPVNSIGAKVAQLDGPVTTDGSVKKQIKDASDAIKGNLSEGDASTLEAINNELDGIDSKLNTLEKNGTVKEGDKILSQDGTNGLSATLSIGISTESGKEYIVLKGINDAEIAKVDASQFVKDGMIDSVTYDPATHKLTITFNTAAGKDAIVVDLSGLVDEYTGTAGQVVVTGRVISLADDVTTKLSKAENSIQSVTGSGEATATTTNGAVTIGVTKATYTQVEGATEKTLSDSGLVDASVLANYVSDKAVDKDALTEVEGGNGIIVSAKTSKKQTVSVKLKTDDDNALSVDANGLFMSKVIDCGTY